MSDTDTTTDTSTIDEKKQGSNSYDYQELSNKYNARNENATDKLFNFNGDISYKVS